MSHEDINEASGDSRIQSGADSGADGQNTEIRGSENHDISRIADQGVEHDRRFDSEGDGSPVVSTSLTHMEVTSGPLPSSKELAGYEQTLPGAADRILRMAEDSLHSEIDSQKRIVEIYADDRKAENWVYKFTTVVFSLVPAAAFICSVVFFRSGHEPGSVHQLRRKCRLRHSPYHRGVQIREGLEKRGQAQVGKLTFRVCSA